MEIDLFKKALTSLLREAYIGPDDPKQTWFASNTEGSGILGTLARVSAKQAFQKSPGVSRSIAEHTSHLAFALRIALQYAKGNFASADWKMSWQPGEESEGRWAALQSELRIAYEALANFAQSEETWTEYNSIAGFMGQLAHGAYHLGAIRQLTQLAGVKLPQEAGGTQAG